MSKPEDVMQMHQRSSINLVDKKQAAALIVSEKRDCVASFEQIKIIIAKAKAPGKK